MQPQARLLVPRRVAPGALATTRKRHWRDVLTNTAVNTSNAANTAHTAVAAAVAISVAIAVTAVAAAAAIRIAAAVTCVCAGVRHGRFIGPVVHLVAKR
eukprot:5440558-Pleurochrysis_carterae.AAC.1